MSYKVKTSILVLVLVFMGCGKGEKAALDNHSRTFSSIQDAFNSGMRTVKSRTQYDELQQSRTRDLNRLLKQLPQKPKTAEAAILKARILVNLNRIDEADTLITSIGKRGQTLSPAPAMVQVLIHMARRDANAALTVFRSIENHAIDASDRFNAYLFFAMVPPEPGIRREYARKFIETPDIPPHFDLFRANVLQMLAQLDLEDRQFESARGWLDKAIAASQDPTMTASLQSEKERMQVLGSPAIELEAETWFNSSATRLESLKGSVVLVDFWAPWCNPCRMVIPELITMYRELRPRGLEIIGLTRLNGFYRDDRENLGKVSAAEEIRLIREFGRRFAIPYPIAVSREGRSFDAYRISGIPTMVLIDRKGRIASIKVGAGRPAALRRTIESLLEETP